MVMSKYKAYSRVVVGLEQLYIANMLHHQAYVFTVSQIYCVVTNRTACLGLQACKPMTSNPINLSTSSFEMLKCMTSYFSS